jgi:hypothetical protein
LVVFTSKSSISGSGLGSFDRLRRRQLRLDLKALVVGADCVIILLLSFITSPTLLPSSVEARLVSDRLKTQGGDSLFCESV